MVESRGSIVPAGKHRSEILSEIRHLLVQGHQAASFGKYLFGGGNSAGIFVSKVSPGIFVIKEKWMPIIFGRIKLPFWG